MATSRRTRHEAGLGVDLRGVSQSAPQTSARILCGCPAAVVFPLTGSTRAPSKATPGPPNRVGSIKRVPMIARHPARVLSKNTFPSKYVGRFRNGLKMCGIDASGHPAEVIEFQSIGNRTNEGGITPTMGPNDPIFDMEGPVSPLGATGPEPARPEVGAIRWNGAISVDVRPEPIGVRSSSPPLGRAATRAETSAPRRNDCPVDAQRKYSVAVLALSTLVLGSHAGCSFRQSSVYPTYSAGDY
jgi:hypothetical protein